CFYSRTFLGANIQQEKPFFTQPQSCLTFIVSINDPLQFLTILGHGAIAIIHASLSSVALATRITSSQEVSPLITFCRPFLIKALCCCRTSRSSACSSTFS